MAAMVQATETALVTIHIMLIAVWLHALPTFLNMQQDLDQKQ